MGHGDDDMTSIAERRARITSDIRRTTGIDEALVSRVVDAFYARVRDDGMLGPIFERRVRDWPTHLEKMRAF